MFRLLSALPGSKPSFLRRPPDRLPHSLEPWKAHKHDIQNWKPQSARLHTPSPFTEWHLAGSWHLGQGLRHSSMKSVLATWKKVTWNDFCLKKNIFFIFIWISSHFINIYLPVCITSSKKNSPSEIYPVCCCCAVMGLKRYLLTVGCRNWRFWTGPEQSLKLTVSAEWLWSLRQRLEQQHHPVRKASRTSSSVHHTVPGWKLLFCCVYNLQLHHVSYCPWARLMSSAASNKHIRV